MSLKIEHIDTHQVKGILDGDLNFEVSEVDGRIVTKIKDWTHQIADNSVRTIAEMRGLAYAGLARYRMHQRNMEA